MAGSPAHAEVVDVAGLAKVLEAGVLDRVRFSPIGKRFELLTEGSIISVSHSVGDLKMRFGEVEDGWLYCDGCTIGNPSSGADFTGSGYQSLFEHLWNSASNSQLPIENSSGTPTTRGADAASDWLADKRMPVPDLRGRMPLGQDDMGGSSANRVSSSQADVMGGSGGDDTHTLTESEIPPHNHVMYSGRQNATGSNSARMRNLDAGQGSYNTQNTGGGNAHNNMPPYLTINYCIYAGC